MKKVIFSAIAIIAFVGSSMASTIEISKCDFVVRDCIAEATEKVRQEEELNGCLTATQYAYLLGVYFRKCQSSPDPCISQSVE